MLSADRIISVEPGEGVSRVGARLVLIADQGRHRQPVALRVGLDVLRRSLVERCAVADAGVKMSLRHTAVVIEIDADDKALGGVLSAVLTALAQPPEVLDTDVLRVGAGLELAWRDDSALSRALALAEPLFFTNGYWSPSFERQIDGYQEYRGVDVTASLRDLLHYRATCFVGSRANAVRLAMTLLPHIPAASPATSQTRQLPLPIYPSKSLTVRASAPGSQAHLLFVGAAPAATDLLFPAALVANDILGGAHPDSLLVTRVRRAAGFAYAASSFFRVLSVPSMWCAFVSCAPSKVADVQNTIEQLVAELPKLLADSVSLPAFARAAGEEPYEIDTPVKRLDRAVMRECLGLPVFPLAFDTDHVGDASLRDCGRYFGSLPLQTVELWPLALAEKIRTHDNQ